MAKVAGVNILVVEDQRAVAGALRMRLRGLGYDVLAIAKDGIEAIEKARELRPDLILMDIKLGDGIDGIEAAQQIRAQLDIPVVYVSAYADRALLDRARATHPAGFINKPFTTKDLLTAINLALHRTEEQRHAHHLRDTTDGKDSDAVITADRDGRVTFINRHAEELTGWTRESLNGQTLATVLSTLYGLSADAATALIQAALADGVEHALMRDAGVITASDRLTALRNPRGEFFGLALRLSTDVASHSVAALQQSTNALRLHIDQMPLGMVLINRELRILHLNRQARVQLEAHPGVALSSGHLRALDADEHLALQALVTRASERGRVQKADQVTSEICTLRLRDEDRRLVLVGMPVPADPEGAIALLVFGSPAYRDLSAPVLHQIYGLTRAEVTLVKSLARGFSLEEAAHDIGIAVNTARTHLKHIFVKTGSKRQSELIHEMETGPASLPLKLENPQ